MAILDHRGQPVETSSLTKEIATPSISGVRQSFHEGINDLTPQKLAAILLSVDQGEASDYLTLAEQMEERDLHYGSVLRTRKLAVSSLKVVVDAASDDARDVEMADALTRLTKGEAFHRLVADQLDALGKGYSVSEIQWDKSGKLWRPARYTHRDPRWFQFDRETGQELRLRDESDQVNGLPLAPYKFIVHYPQLKTGLPIRGGLARLAVVAFMCKSYALKDWMAFAEVFGMPLRVGKYGSAATEADKAALLRAISNIGTDAAAMIPEGMLIEFISQQSTTGGDKLFLGIAEYLDGQTSKGVLGHSSSADSTAGKLGNDKDKSEVRADYRDDDALKLGATLNRDLGRPFIDLNYGVPKDEAYPIIRLFKEEQEDLQKFGEAVSIFIDRGMRVEESAVLDKFGLQVPEEGAILLKPATAGGAFPMGPAPTPAPGNKTSEDDIAEPVSPTTALNAAQIMALDALLQKVTDGKASPKAIVRVIVQSFPISQNDAEAMVADALEFEPKEAEPPPAPFPPKADPFPPKKAKEPPPEDKLAQVRRDARVQLTMRIMEGTALTADQRALMGIAGVATAAAEPQDDIDEMTEDALGNWRPVMDPITDPIIAMAASATSLEDLLKKLKGAKLDTAALMKTVATLTFQARGLGDASDQ